LIVSDDARASLDGLLDGEALSDDALAGTFRVLQRVRGHRYSLDDVATAWEAARAQPDAARVLDLGCGLGSVLLMLAWKLPRARLVGVEAQDISMALARRNVARNAGVAERTTLVLGDLRDDAVLARALEGGPFDLVSGTPPYMLPGTATPSPDAQRAHARIELRGGVEAYLGAMARALAPGGVGVVCADARTPERALEGAARAGLVCVRRRDVVPRAGHKGALFSVFTCKRTEDAPGAGLVVEAPLVARDEGGGRTEAAHELRRFFDLPVDVLEPPSP
jgi:tRNA1(Val) A37 N6-methylase TrmN6